MININNINPGDFRHRISIYNVAQVEDSEGFQVEELSLVLTTNAFIKTTRGFTLIKNGTKFDEAYTNFTIRHTAVPIERGMVILYNNIRYVIQYVNNIDHENVLIELQAKEVTH